MSTHFVLKANPTEVGGACGAHGLGHGGPPKKAIYGQNEAPAQSNSSFRCKRFMQRGKGIESHNWFGARNSPIHPFLTSTQTRHHWTYSSCIMVLPVSFLKYCNQKTLNYIHRFFLEGTDMLIPFGSARGLHDNGSGTLSGAAICSGGRRATRRK